MAISGRVAAAATPWWVPVALAVGVAGAAWASAPDTEATIVGAATLLPVLAVTASLGWSTPAGWSAALPALAFAVTVSTRGRPSSFVAIACSAAVLVVGTALARRERRHRVVAQVVAIVDALVLDAAVARTLGVEPGLTGAGRAVLWTSGAVATIAIVVVAATRPVELDVRGRPKRRAPPSSSPKEPDPPRT
jgi:hypothetical protein